MKFRAAILTELKQPIVIEEIESGPLRFGQVLVKIHCSGICGAQINEIEGAKGPDKFLPHLLSNEATATVQEAGEGVTSVKPGDRVCHWRKGAQACKDRAATPRSVSRINLAGHDLQRVFRHLREHCTHPPDFDAEAGAFSAVRHGAMGAKHNAKLGIGESIVILGTGAGLVPVPAAMVGRIIGVDRDQTGSADGRDTRSTDAVPTSSRKSARSSAQRVRMWS